MPDETPIEPGASAPAEDAHLNTPEAWAALHKTAPHLLVGALRHNRWVDGDQITEAAYLAGIQSFGEEPLR